MANSTPEQLITIDPDILGGTPVFAGTRVPLSALFDNLADGLTIDELVDSYPTLSRELIVKVLESPDQVQRAQAAQAANGIMSLDGPPLTKEVAAVVNRIISGELTTEQAVQMKIDEIRKQQQCQARTAASSEKLDLALAVKLFKDGTISVGRAASVAGMDRESFMDRLGELGVPVVNYDAENLADESEHGHD